MTGRDGRIYTVGGITPFGKPTAIVRAYSIQTHSWTRLANMPTPRRDLAATVGPDGRIYAIGGRDTQLRDDLMEAYSPDTDSWATLPPLPHRRTRLAATAGADGRIYVFGGYEMPDVIAAVDVYNPATRTWAAAAPIPTPRYDFDAVGGGDGWIYTIGGMAETGVSAVVEAYAPATNSWRARTPMPTGRAALAAVRGRDNRLYAIGGTQDGRAALATVESYWPGNNSWSVAAPLQTGRWDLGATSAPNGWVYAIGGASDLDSPILSTAEALLPVGRTPADPLTAGPAGAQFFLPTGHTLSGAFLDFWNRNGGLDVFGYPRTEAYADNGRTAQYTERFRLELVGTRMQVAPLGRLLTAGRLFSPAVLSSPSPTKRFFPSTRHSLSGRFLAYWLGHHGPNLLGAPIAEPTSEQNGDGTGRFYQVQWLENARLEYHPELAGTAYTVGLGLLGTQALQQKQWIP